MIALLDSVGKGFGSFVKDGQYLMLFMIALLLLWLTENQSKKDFRMFSFVMLLLLICPLTAKALAFYQTKFYSYEDMWELLPVTAVLSYGLVAAFFKMQEAMAWQYGRWKAAASKKKAVFREILAGVILTALLFLCGTLSPGKTMTEEYRGSLFLPESVEEALGKLQIQEDTPVFLVAPDEIVAWARIYSGNILLPYGRDLTEPELSAFTYDMYGADLRELHDWVNGSLPVPDASETALMQSQILLSGCASNGYDYLIFSLERMQEESLQEALKNQKEYTLFAGTDKYVIYKLRHGG